MNGPSSDEAFDSVTFLVMRIGRMLGAPVRVVLAEDGSTVVGTLAAYRLAQDGGRGGLYVDLREHPGEMRVERVEPASVTAGPEIRALPSPDTEEGSR